MLTVRHVMSSDVVSIRPESTLYEALTLFARHRISGAPVASQGTVVGVVSLSDLVGIGGVPPARPDTRPPAAADQTRDAAGPGRESSEAPAAYFGEAWADSGAALLEQPRQPPGWGRDDLSRRTVSQVMSRPICWVPPDLSVRDAAAYMTRAGVHRVLVLEENRLVGVLSAVDIVRALGDGEVV